MSENEVDDDDVDDGEDEVVFELSDWNDTDRAALRDRLTAAGIAHEWDDGDLVVAEADADAADDAIDAIEYPDELPADDGEGDEPAGEGDYAVMSALFLAADRLRDAPDDPAVGGEFDVAAEAAGESPPPYGVDAGFWRQVQDLASSICDQLDEAADDVVSRDAAALRQLLARYV